MADNDRIHWQGRIESVGCRTWIWRYITDNRTHHHIGYNLFLAGEADGREGRFSVAVSEKQYAKHRFRIGDRVQGTAWPCVKARHDIADYYRAGGFKVLARGEEGREEQGPPFTGPLPDLATFELRGARMLSASLWAGKCFPCMWANKAAVEIEYSWGKVKRYRQETFCYGPRSCPFYRMGRPRSVPHNKLGPCLDDGFLDDLCTEQRPGDWD